MERNPQTSLKAVTLFHPAQVTATQTLNNSAPNLDIDTMGFEEMLILVTVGVAASTGTLDVILKESSTAGGSPVAYTAITGAAFTTLSEANDNVTKLGRLKLEGRKRYISATLTEASGTYDGFVTVTVILIGPRDTVQQTAQSYDFSVVG